MFSWILSPFQLTPIERYAVQFSELMMEPVNEEELKTAEVNLLFISWFVENLGHEFDQELNFLFVVS